MRFPVERMNIHRRGAGLVGVVIAALAGCGTATSSRSGGHASTSVRATTPSQPSGRGPPRTPTRSGAAPAPRRSTIELASGRRFVRLVARTEFRPGPQDVTVRDGGVVPSHCSLYVLRATAGELQEGNGQVDCELPMSARVADRVRLRRVRGERGAMLRRVLQDARATPEGEKPRRPRGRGAEHYRIRVRLRTEEGTVSADVHPIAWPPPGGHEASPLGHKPVGLAQLWEAVMYPERYVRAEAAGRNEGSEAEPAGGREGGGGAASRRQPGSPPEVQEIGAPRGDE